MPRLFGREFGKGRRSGRGTGEEAATGERKRKQKEVVFARREGAKVGCERRPKGEETASAAVGTVFDVRVPGLPHLGVV